MKLLLAVLLIVLGFAPPIQAEEDKEETLSLSAIFELSVLSSSKKEEKLIDSPLSISVVSRREMLEAGVTSIPEALNLVAGIINRSQAEGIYDPHIRGFGGLPRNSFHSFIPNLNSLVMIDYRIVYNWYQGGTFWDTLPVAITDVDRIEVVRGPSSALYGPNAATGVIHIITNKEGNRANATVGTFKSFSKAQADISNISAHAGGNISETVSYSLSVGNQERSRTNSDYFEAFSDEKVDREQLKSPRGQAIGAQRGKDLFPYPGKSLSSRFYSGTLLYRPTEETDIRLTGAWQESLASRIWYDNGISPFTTNRSKTRHWDLWARSHGFDIQYTSISGDQILLDTAENVTTLNVTEGRIEYKYEILDGLEIRPGVFTRKAAYDSQIFLGDKYEISSEGLGLRLDYTVNDFRAIAAIRQDSFSHNDKSAPSHQAILSYKVLPQQLVRIVASKASRFPNYFDAFLNQDFPPPIGVVVIADKNLDLPEIEQFELGYRGQFGDITIDTEVYQMRAKNFVRFFTVIPSSKAAEEYNVDVVARNEDTVATQNGLTTSLSYKVSQDLLMKGHFTVQHTDRDTLLADDLNLPDIGGNRVGSEGPVVDSVVRNHSSTPRRYGGLIARYQMNQKLVLNINPRHMAKQDFVRTSTASNTQKIPERTTWNTTLTYYHSPDLSSSLAIRNVSNKKGNEFPWADDVKPSVVLGINAENF
ncbi:MAG: TonB-dependent receptor [Pseudobacteriovorax sp.]|nr:TonB-dependent receptor [Pseudobacteriovorax sp.]